MHVITIQKTSLYAVSLPVNEVDAGIYRIRSCSDYTNLQPGANLIRPGFSITPPHGFRFLICGAGDIEQRGCIISPMCHSRGELTICIQNISGAAIQLAPITVIAELQLISINIRQVRELL